MYINLLLGAVVLVVLWLWLRKLVVRDDSLSETPAGMLEKEVARRKAAEAAATAAFERLREKGVERMRPVAAALAEMRAAVPLPEGGPARRLLAWDDEGDTIRIRVEDAGTGEEVAGLTVSWRVRDLNLGAEGREEHEGLYVLKRSDTGTEERTETLDSCVRGITSFIVDYMP